MIDELLQHLGMTEQSVAVEKYTPWWEKRARAAMAAREKEREAREKAEEEKARIPFDNEDREILNIIKKVHAETAAFIKENGLNVKLASMKEIQTKLYNINEWQKSYKGDIAWIEIDEFVVGQYNMTEERYEEISEKFIEFNKARKAPAGYHSVNIVQNAYTHDMWWNLTIVKEV